MWDFIDKTEFRSCDKNIPFIENNERISELIDNFPLNPNIAEKFAINIYTNDDDKKINKYFRDKSIYLKREIYIDDVSLDNNKFQWVISHLDYLVKEHSLFENTILYRGIDSIDHLERFQEGELIWDLGYCSTSFDVKVAEGIFKGSNGWLMEIHCLKGTKGVFLAKHSRMPLEFEFLLPRNQKFIIFEIDDLNRKFKVFNMNEIIDWI